MTPDEFRKLILSKKDAAVVLLNGATCVSKLTHKQAMEVMELCKSSKDHKKAVKEFRFIQHKNMLHAYIYSSIKRFLP